MTAITFNFLHTLTNDTLLIQNIISCLNIAIMATCNYEKIY
jgi:hypothetical protein